MASTSSSSSGGGPGPADMSVAHRRRLSDLVERGVGGRHRGVVKALFSGRRNNKNCKRAPPVVVDQAWVRNGVACLLGITVVVGLVLTSLHGPGSGSGGGGRLLRRVDADALGWREENLTAPALRPPDPPAIHDVDAEVEVPEVGICGDTWRSTQPLEHSRGKTHLM